MVKKTAQVGTHHQYDQCPQTFQSVVSLGRHYAEKGLKIEETEPAKWTVYENDMPIHSYKLDSGLIIKTAAFEGLTQATQEILDHIESSFGEGIIRVDFERAAKLAEDAKLPPQQIKELMGRLLAIHGTERTFAGAGLKWTK
jgi:hypothetical protein